MMEFGRSLRLAREARGYSVAQLAEITRMAPKTVQELEDENLSHIAAPIYGRGFVKLYCEAVGLEAKPFIDEFMAIYRGERDVSIRERIVHEAPMPRQQTSPKAEPAAADAPTPMQGPAQTPDAAPMPEAMPEAAPVTAPEPPPPLTDLPIFGDAPAPRKPLVAAAATTEASAPPSAAPLSRYAAPVRKERLPTTLSPTIWRVGVLAAAAILAIWLLFLGVRALYRATSGGSSPAQEEKTTPTAEEAKPAKPAEETPKPTGESAQRQLQSIPSIYID